MGRSWLYSTISNKNNSAEQALRKSKTTILSEYHINKATSSSGCGLVNAERRIGNSIFSDYAFIPVAILEKTLYIIAVYHLFMLNISTDMSKANLLAGFRQPVP